MSVIDKKSCEESPLHLTASTLSFSPQRSGRPPHYTGILEAARITYTSRKRYKRRVQREANPRMWLNHRMEFERMEFNERRKNASSYNRDREKYWCRHHFIFFFSTLCLSVVRSSTALSTFVLLSNTPAGSCFVSTDHFPCSYDGIWTLDGAVLDASRSAWVKRLQQQLVSVCTAEA